MTKKRTKLWIAALALPWIAVAVLIVVLAPDDPVNRDTAASAPTSAHPAPSGEEMRVLMVGTGEDRGASTPGGALVGMLMTGDMPSGEMRATVLTDADCAPDAQGYSHCRNDLRMADGSALTVRHVHRMSEVPCLSPGEEILVVPA